MADTMELSAEFTDRLGPTEQVRAAIQEANQKMALAQAQAQPQQPQGQGQAPNAPAAATTEQGIK